jgi:hypothetical protein
LWRGDAAIAYATFFSLGLQDLFAKGSLVFLPAMRQGFWSVFRVVEILRQSV